MTTEGLEELRRFLERQAEAIKHGAAQRPTAGIRGLRPRLVILDEVADLSTEKETRADD